MREEVEYSLNGAFKVDLYSGDQFMETTDWFSNFITHTGLYYPSVYPFVDCFRYLSLGSSAGGSIPNSGYTAGNPTNYTTGLASPISSYSTNSGNQVGQYIDWQGYETDGEQSPCGTTLTEEGFSFFRAWSIPTGGIGCVMQESSPAGLQIGEFMVSPSSGTDPIGKYAFSRVIRSLAIPNGWRAIVTYQLKVKTENTGIVYTSSNFLTSNADITNDPDLVDSWTNFYLRIKQVYPGLMCIDKRGASYIPKYGAIMEPCLSDLSQMAFYLSPDNCAFAVNGKNGGTQATEVDAYKANGTMDGLYVHRPDFNFAGMDDFDTADYATKKLYYEKSYLEKQAEGTTPDVITPRNIRLGMAAASGCLKTPSLRNYSLSNATDLGTFNYQEFQQSANYDIGYATPASIDETTLNLGQKAVFSSRVFKLPTYNPTGRKKTVTRKTMFSPASSLGTNTRFGSLVAAFNIDKTVSFPDKTYYPMVDCLFSARDETTLPSHYRLIPYIYLTDRGTGIASCKITLGLNGNTGQSDFNQRIWQRQVFCGPYNASYADGIDQNHPMFSLVVDPNQTEDKKYAAYLMTGLSVPSDLPTGDILPHNDYNCTGFGCVYGIIVPSGYHNLPYDCGIYSSERNGFAIPVNSVPIYWRDALESDPTKQITVTFSDIVFSDDGVVFQEDPGGTDENLATVYGWSRPKGYVYHVENIGATGFRLLPPSCEANNSGINTYMTKDLVGYGNNYPGLSLDNGLDLYFSISWKAPCGSAQNCVDA